MVITHLLNGMILQAWYFRGIILRILDIRWCFRSKHFLFTVSRRRSKRSFSMSVASACRDTRFLFGGVNGAEWFEGTHPYKLTVCTWKWMVGIRLFPLGMAQFHGLCFFPGREYVYKNEPVLHVSNQRLVGDFVHVVTTGRGPIVVTAPYCTTCCFYHLLLSILHLHLAKL